LDRSRTQPLHRGYGAGSKNAVLFLLNLAIAAQRVPTAARMHMSPHDAEIFADFSRKPPFLDHFEDETRNEDAD